MNVLDIDEILVLKATGLTQKAIAQQLGFSESAVSRALRRERAHPRPRPKLGAAVAEMLEASTVSPVVKALVLDLASAHDEAVRDGSPAAIRALPALGVHLSRVLDHALSKESHA